MVGPLVNHRSTTAIGVGWQKRNDSDGDPGEFAVMAVTIVAVSAVANSVVTVAVAVVAMAVTVVAATIWL